MVNVTYLIENKVDCNQHKCNSESARNERKEFGLIWDVDLSFFVGLAACAGHQSWCDEIENEDYAVSLWMSPQFVIGMHMMNL